MPKSPVKKLRRSSASSAGEPIIPIGEIQPTVPPPRKPESPKKKSKGKGKIGVGKSLSRSLNGDESQEEEVSELGSDEESREDDNTPTEILDDTWKNFNIPKKTGSQKKVENRQDILILTANTFKPVKSFNAQTVSALEQYISSEKAGGRNVLIAQLTCKVDADNSVPEGNKD